MKMTVYGDENRRSLRAPLSTHVRTPNRREWRSENRTDTSKTDGNYLLANTRAARRQIHSRGTPCCSPTRHWFAELTRRFSFLRDIYLWGYFEPKNNVLRCINIDADEQLNPIDYFLEKFRFRRFLVRFGRRNGSTFICSFFIRLSIGMREKESFLTTSSLRGRSKFAWKDSSLSSNERGIFHRSPKSRDKKHTFGPLARQFNVFYV